MNFLTDKIRPIYFKYLAAAFGSAMITSVYSVVDTAMVGQYHGPDSTAALAVVAPVWNIIYSLGLLTGIGGSVLLSTLRGQAPGNEKRSNEYFTAAVLATAVLSLLSWAALILFDRQLLTLFGVTRDLHGEDQYLEIEVIGLVDGRHQRFFRRHHVIRARFEMGEQRLDDLYTE